MAEDLRGRGYTDADAERIAVAMDAYGARERIWPSVARMLEYVPKTRTHARLDTESWENRKRRNAGGVRSLREILGKVAPKA